MDDAHEDVGRFQQQGKYEVLTPVARTFRRLYLEDAMERRIFKTAAMVTNFGTVLKMDWTSIKQVSSQLLLFK